MDVVVLAWRRFGPYHHARAREAASRLRIVGLESSSVDKVNDWAPIPTATGFQKITLFPGRDLATVPSGELRNTIAATLGRLQPQVVAVNGYAGRDALALLEWALRFGRAAIVLSESNVFDEPRRPWREGVKRRLVRLFSAGLAGGSHSRDYLISLGLSPETVFVGYDAVDNQHFAARPTGAHALQANVGGRFFLVSARFIEKKNLFRVFEAYARYRALAPSDAWRLVVLGDGELRQLLEAHRQHLQFGGSVLLPGYKQYDELPAWYAAASCLLHASTSEQWGLVANEAMAAGLPVLVSNRCGCAADLVREGVNGFTFDPFDTEEIARLMYRMSHGDVDRASMGRESEKIIAAWGTSRFARGLAEAVDTARAAGPKKANILDRALLSVLLRL